MKPVDVLVTLTLAVGCANPDTQTPAADARADTIVAAATPDTYLISNTGIGAIQLTMTVGEATRALPSATFARTSDGDGLALVLVTLAADTSVTLFADEDDAEAPVDTSKRITRIETFSPAFHTREGVRPGALVVEVERVFGKTREILKSEIEAREFIEFEKQPAFLTLRLDYTGVFGEGSRTTRLYKPEARILSIAVSSMNR